MTERDAALTENNLVKEELAASRLARLGVLPAGARAGSRSYTDAEADLPADQAG